MLNSETWVGLTLAKEDIETLISVDGTLMRRLLEVPVSASKASLYFELGCIPIRYIIKARRLLFLQYLLKRNKNETISKVFWSQKISPVKNDWWLQVEKDLKEFQLDHFSLNQIANMSKDLFKKFVNQSCKNQAFKFLLQEKENFQS